MKTPVGKPLQGDPLMLRIIGSVTVLALLISGCGGGSSSSNGPPPAPVVVDASPPPPGVVTNAYGFYFNASGGSAPYTWTVASGALPSGLTLASDGTLSGTPTSAGSFAFTLKATDSAQQSGTSAMTFSITITVPAALSIDPGQVPPAGVHGTNYGIGFTATGGYLPLTWAVTAGTLPPGLALGADGTLSGTPTMASTTPFTFTITVTDNSAPTPAKSSADYSITVSEPPPPAITSLAPPTASVGSPYSFQFSTSDGLAPLVWTPPAAPMGGLAFSPDGILSGTPATAGIFPITLTVTDALNQTSPATPVTVRIAMARPAAAFTKTGSLNYARTGHTATLLLDGRVLIAGGGVATAELYDPTSGTFTPTGSMTLVQDARSATLLTKSTLPNYGKVLMVGGGDMTAELYDPMAGTFVATGSALAPHLGQTATLLQNGQVLVAGGETTSAELYDPSTGKFTATGSMTISRTAHTATLLSDGRVLITGGVQDFGPGTVPIPISPAVASAELYDPATGTFTPTGSMGVARAGHTATLLNDGTVLVAGSDGNPELYNPGSGTFSATGPVVMGIGATATLRKDGTVLVAGGRIRSSSATVNLFAPECAGFVAASSLLTARDGHTATLLADGTVLVTGGTNRIIGCPHWGCHSSTTVLASAELFK